MGKEESAKAILVTNWHVIQTARPAKENTFSQGNSKLFTAVTEQ